MRWKRKRMEIYYTGGYRHWMEILKKSSGLGCVMGGLLELHIDYNGLKN